MIIEEEEDREGEEGGVGGGEAGGEDSCEVPTPSSAATTAYLRAIKAIGGTNLLCARSSSPPPSPHRPRRPYP